MNLKALRKMDKYTVKKLFRGHYQVLDDRGESLFKGSISDCYAWLRIIDINILEE
jgi:hypothetical protein